MQTHSEENYIKVIYLLSSKGKEKVSATSLASALGINAASTVDMLRRLKEKKLVEYDKIKGARLTSPGVKSALLTIRKHRLWEVFLQNKLGYSWDEVHDIAEQLEHVKEENLADKLEKYLGYPQYDPHGEAIPKSNGQIADISSLTLDVLKLGQECRVVAVKDTSKSFLQYLKKLHIGIGTNLKLIEKIEFDGSLVIQIEKSAKSTVSELFASSIFVV